MGTINSFKDIQVQALKCIISIQVWCATTFFKNPSNGLKYVLMKCYGCLLSCFHFSFFGCNSEVKILILIFMRRLRGWTKSGSFITKNAHLHAFYHPWNPRQQNLNFMCPNGYSLQVYFYNFDWAVGHGLKVQKNC